MEEEGVTEEAAVVAAPGVADLAVVVDRTVAAVAIGTSPLWSSTVSNLHKHGAGVT